MERMITKLVCSLTVVMLGVIFLVVQHDRLIEEREKNATLTQAISARDETILQLQQMEASNKKQLAQLQTERRRISATLSGREAFIEKLHHDNAQLQDWATAPLPDAVVRLRHRDAATGASDYHPTLPEPDAVLSAASQP